MSTTQKKYRDEDWLRTEYVEKGRSSTDMADELNVDHKTILNWLEKCDIERRSAASTQTGGSTEKLRNEEWLKKQYHEKNKSNVEIAEELGCSDSTVSSWKNKHGIETETNKLQNKEWLVEQYIEKEKSSIEIGKQLGCSRSNVCKYLSNHNIETRDNKEYAEGNIDKLRDSEWLYKEYVEKEKTALQISEDLMCAETTVLKWLRKNNIETYSRYNHYQSSEDVPDYIDHKIRSSWELTVAEMLIDNDVDYEYESMEIEYEDSTYIPDFITDDYIIEVKGWTKESDKEKAETTMEKIDDKQYVVVGSELPCDVHIDWGNRSELVELLT